MAALDTEIVQLESMELWALKIMGRLYYHMELTTEGNLLLV